MAKVFTPKLILQESGKAILDTLEMTLFIAFAITGIILGALLVGGFLALPVLIANYLQITPEFTDYTLFQNWLTTTTFFWATFWVTASYKLCNRLKKIEKLKGK